MFLGGTFARSFVLPLLSAIGLEHLSHLALGLQGESGGGKRFPLGTVLHCPSRAGSGCKHSPWACLLGRPHARGWDSAFLGWVHLAPARTHGDRPQGAAQDRATAPYRSDRAWVRKKTRPKKNPRPRSLSSERGSEFAGMFPGIGPYWGGTSTQNRVFLYVSVSG